MGKKKERDYHESAVELDPVNNGPTTSADADAHATKYSKNGKRYGKPTPYDPNFRGPIEKRTCRDPLWCLIFGLFWIGMIVVGGLAFRNGDPERLLHPTDSEGNLCGRVNQNRDLTNKTKLVFFDIVKCLSITALNGCNTPQVCVEECPTDFYIAGASAYDANVQICDYDVDKSSLNQATIVQKVFNEQCAPYTLPSKSILRRCVPFPSKINYTELAASTGSDQSVVEQAQSNLAKVVGAGGEAEKFFNDVADSWEWILAGSAMAMGFSLVYILLMQWLAGVMVWFAVLVGSLLMIALSGFLWYEWNRVKNSEDGEDPDLTSFEQNVGLAEYAEKTRLILAICCTVIALLIILALIFLRKRIRIAIKIVKEASKAIRKMMLLLFFPMFTWFSLILLFSWWAATSLWLATSSDSVYYKYDAPNVAVYCSPPVTDACKANATFGGYETSSTLIYMELYNLFGLFWTWNFIHAFGQCTIAGAVAAWYWTRLRDDLSSTPILSSFTRTGAFHLGSLAFGSLLIAIVQLMRVALEMVEAQIRDKETTIVKIIVCCLRCCLWCLEKFLKMLTRNAYIEIAIYGYGFCKAARKAFKLLMRNCLRLLAVDRVSGLILFLGRVAVTCLNVFIGYHFFKGRKDELNYYMSPVIIIGIVTFVVASAFFHVYEMAIDTIFLAFCEDCERNDGSEEKPYHMSKGLQKLLNKENKRTSAASIAGSG